MGGWEVEGRDPIRTMSRRGVRIFTAHHMLATVFKLSPVSSFLGTEECNGGT